MVIFDRETMHITVVNYIHTQDKVTNCSGQNLIERRMDKKTVKREHGIEHLHRTIGDPLIPILARVISRPNRGSYGNKVGDTSHKWDRLTVNTRTYIGLRRVRGRHFLSPRPGLSKNKQLKLGGPSLSWHHSRVVPL